MRVLTALTYYRPHVSGLTIYAERLARGLARRGHRVTVLTSRFDRRLPHCERRDGVHVLRVPVVTKLSKGVVMPGFLPEAWRQMRRADVVHVHMPQLEAGPLAVLARRARRPVIVTYHCDLKLPAGWINRLVDAALPPLNALALGCAGRIVVNSLDYAQASSMLSLHRHKVEAILPPIDLAPPREEARARLARRWGIGKGGPWIAFAARFAEEKGVEHLLRALPQIAAEFPGVRVAFTGAYRDTIGEESYWRRLRPLLEAQRGRLTFLDLLDDEDMSSFFSLCDVLVVTSLNSTESFGMVQAEAMRAGTPVVATDLPGIREAVRLTGMGRLVPPADPDALAAALVEVLRNRAAHVRPPDLVAGLFDPERTVSAYEELFAQIAGQ